MGFKCEGCGEHVQGPRLKPDKQISQTRVVVETRYREYVNFKDHKPVKSKGEEIVKEIVLCPACHEAMKHK